MADSFIFQTSSALAAILFSPAACVTYAGLAVFFVAVVIVDVSTGRSLRRYWSATFRTDIVYMFLLVGGIYGLVQLPVIALVDGLLRRYASFLYLDLLKDFPAPFQIAGFLVLADFCRYWKHRLLHSVSWLWAFHCVHHAPREINFLTNYRLHLVEFIADGLVILVPIVLLGVPPTIWLPVTLLLLWYTSLMHSDLDLTFGRLGRIFVSPHFHRIHHSAERCVSDSNFGAGLSIWDTLFGTARFERERPASYGLSDIAVPEGILGQAVFPLRYLAGHVLTKLRGRTAGCSPTERNR